MRREYPGCPKLNFPTVDVRAVATAHIAAMTIPEASGKRSEISNQFIKKVLDWNPHSLEEMVVAMGKSMIEHGVV
jgi:hypothetical protein